MSDFIQASLHDSGSETSSGNSAALDVKHESGPFAFVLDVTAYSGTTPTLDVDIEGYDPLSDKWLVLTSFTQVGEATGNELKTLDNIAFARIRAAWTLAGTTPDYTFTIAAHAKPRY